MPSSDVALKFVMCANSHDVDGLVALMTADHVFIDSLGDKSSRPAVDEGWKRYLEMVPDYWIRVDRALSDGDTSVLIGEAGGTYVPKGGALSRKNEWRTPAVWVAKILGERVAEWRIFCDNEPIRAKMR